MEYTLTLRFKNAREMQQAVSLLSQEVKCGSDKDLGTDKGASEAGYTPSCDKTRLALDALGKCQRVQLARPAILESWLAAFPHVDIAYEIAKAEAWAQSKDVKRSAKGWAKALNSWLGRAQDQARGSNSHSPNTNGPVSIQRAHVIDPSVDAWAKAAQE